MKINKECKNHGMTLFRKSGTKYRCCKCLSEAVKKRRRKLKILAVEYKNGSCEKCGYDKCIEALEFHHNDPNEKDFGISAKGHTRSFEKIKLELDKCVLLCANCHRETHVELNISE